MLKKRLFFFLLAATFVVAGCGQPSLKLVKAEFAESVKGLNDYVAAKKTTFKSGETLNVYVQVQGFQSNSDGDKFTSWPMETIKVRDNKGKLIFTQKVFSDMKTYDEKQTEFALPFQVTLTGEKGPYRIEGIVEDGITGERLTFELGLTLE
ncbi:MAG: hypothetical protein KBC08_00840 [Caldisericia bacterium]|jgi:hypothetical protein|nr:hypothetical protein [Caldisericia bacterium]